MSEGTVALAAIGLVGTILTLVVSPLFKLLNAQTKATEKLAKSMDSVAKANKAMVKEAKKGNQESADRNGHLGEQNVKITELVIESNKQTLAALQNMDIKSQHVEKQVVEKQETHEQS